eukprot:TRINITY_DN4661_c0_g2_i3.p1 TRINITY_DN4661_c0_g2~~TRINITY_DN4661_c0_g2_i3.p1  ORF type:complete len:359 (-),score=62.17 TRINITY_DN4661_c0_g2_i3:529-1605(-)
MVAASEVMGLMNVEGVNYEICVRNTFVHVVERPVKRRMSAPAALAVLNFDNTFVEDTNGENTYSLDEHDTFGEAYDSNFYDYCVEDTKDGNYISFDDYDGFGAIGDSFFLDSCVEDTHDGSTCDDYDGLGAACASYFKDSCVEDTYDGNTSSFDDYDTSGETFASKVYDSCDEDPKSLNLSAILKDGLTPREMQDETGVVSIKADGQQCGWNLQTVVSDAASASDECAHSTKRLLASERVSLSVDGRSHKTQAVSEKSRGPRGTARSKAITRMFIGNLPCSMSTDRMAAELCKHGFFGTYTSVNVPRKADGIGRGFGFVRFCNAEEAQRFASVFRGCEYEGKRCYVNPAARQSNPSIP